MPTRLGARGLGLQPVSAYYLDTPRERGLVLGFANVETDDAEGCIRQLRHAIDTTLQ
ncbi:hypothetical protein [Rhodovibrio sodomensis]|uniref:hypothetical protein n=1 Tax=Rhodovibrio sodomensis TaxID=1088 RepID=UPI00190397F2|nr:hypothetical protein [Rhodovibrio sodomensis]